MVLRISRLLLSHNNAELFILHSIHAVFLQVMKSRGNITDHSLLAVQLLTLLCFLPEAVDIINHDKWQ